MATEEQLYDALDQCLERLAAGETIEDCVKSYPQHEDRLRQLLRVATLVERAQYSESQVSDAQARGRSRLSQTMTRRTSRRSWFMPLMAAASFTLVIGIVALILIVMNGDDDGTAIALNQTRTPLTGPDPTVFALASQTAQQAETLTSDMTAAAAPPNMTPQLESLNGNEVASTATSLANVLLFGPDSTDADAGRFPQDSSLRNPQGQGGGQIIVAPPPLPPQAGGPAPTGLPQVGGGVIQPLPDTGGGADPNVQGFYGLDQEEPLQALQQAPQIYLVGTPAPQIAGNPTGTALAMLPAQTATLQPLPTATITSTPAPTLTPTETATHTPTPLPTATVIPTGIPDMPPDMFFQNYGVNPFLDTEDDALSTFAMDVDTASYTLTRSLLTDRSVFPPPDAIRPEEFINFFDVGYPGPDGDDAFAIHLEAAPAPFGFTGHQLLRIGLQGRRISDEARDPALLVFVVDVSGSMADGGRLETVKEALRVLVAQLRADDRIGIVTYTDYAEIALEPTSAANVDQILPIINSLQPLNSTNAEAGLQMGYIMARAFAEDEQINRVILLSDGVANVGMTDPDGILGTIRSSVEEGITLTSVGVGLGNFNDVLLEQLADNGNGNYFYIDDVREATRIFGEELTGTLQVIAFDAKVQVEFNPEVTDRYRLIGYENRDVADVDFRNDSIDAGEVGAGHSVTAMYELALEDVDAQGTIATVFVRYEDARTGEVVEIRRDITTADLLPSIDDASVSFHLHAAVAEFAEIMRQSFWAQGSDLGAVLDLVRDVPDAMPDNEAVAEFVELVRLAGRIVDR